MPVDASVAGEAVRLEPPAAGSSTALGTPGIVPRAAGASPDRGYDRLPRCPAGPVSGCRIGVPLRGNEPVRR